MVPTLNILSRLCKTEDTIALTGIPLDSDFAEISLQLRQRSLIRLPHNHIVEASVHNAAAKLCLMTHHYNQNHWGFRRQIH